MKKIFLLFWYLLITLTTAAQNNPKINIDITTISYVEIIKVNSSDKHKYKTKKMSKEQYLDFAQKWNVSKKLGADKYNMKYFVEVVLKNGQKRQFSIRDKRIQEADWATYDIGDKQYFDKIWATIK
jgi:hypothetical protein